VFYLLSPDDTITRTEDRDAWDRNLQERGILLETTSESLGYLVTVRTEFLGQDPDDAKRPPLLFRTTVTGGRFNGRTWRCASPAFARRHHRRVSFAVSTDHDPDGGAR
jgi:hypothetical protein